MPLTERPLGAQMKRAERLGARFAAVRRARTSSRAGRFGLKDLATGEQDATLDEAGIVAARPRERIAWR